MPSVLLDHEKLHAYQVALELMELLQPLLVRKRCPTNVRDQLERASQSILANIAEGAGRTSKPDKRRFYEMAKGSATECAAHLDILRIRRLVSKREYENTRDKVVRLVTLLFGLAGPPRNKKPKPD